jgi:polyhydroxyalkanoate synthesis regulator phasin
MHIALISDAHSAGLHHTMSITNFSIAEASREFKKSRNTIAKHIKDGTLSKDSDGKISLSELLRVYGALPSSNAEQQVSSTAEQPSALRDEQVEQLKKQIDFLEKQVEWLQGEIGNQRQARIEYQQKPKRGLLGRIFGD